MSYRFPISDQELVQMRKEVESLTHFADLFNVHIVITDRNGNIIYGNKAAQELTGYTLGEMVGNNPGDLWGGNEPNSFYEKMWRKIKIDKQKFSGIVKNKSKTGEEFFQNIQITPILDQNGEPKYYIAIEPDATEARLLEEQVVRQTQERSNLLILLDQQRIKISELISVISGLKKNFTSTINLTKKTKL